MTKDEALRLALAALEGADEINCDMRDAITAIKEASAQPEPVALETVYETIIQWDEVGGKRSRRELARRIVGLYKSLPQREWVGLTDGEIRDGLGPEAVRIPPGWSKLTRAIEARLKEKNA